MSWAVWLFELGSPVARLVPTTVVGSQAVDIANENPHKDKKRVNLVFAS